MADIDTMLIQLQDKITECLEIAEALGDYLDAGSLQEYRAANVHLKLEEGQMWLGKMR